MNTTTGDRHAESARLHPIEELEAAHIRQPKIEDATIEGASRSSE